MLVILNSTIEFKDVDGNEVELAEGTEVYLDEDTGVACHGNIHFDLDASEYYDINSHDEDYEIELEELCFS